MRAIIVVMGLCATAGAETPEDLVHGGEELAKAGRYSEAIDLFKAADRRQPRASNACLIALAYTRKEAWPQAEIFLDRCKAGATAGEPLPDWVPTATEQLAERLATVNVAAITLVVEPAGTPVELTVSSFAPDEVFAPRTIHLPPGHHVVTARARGWPDVHQTIEVHDRAAQHVTIHLRKPSIEIHRGRTPLVVLGAGAVVTAVAIGIHATWYRDAYNQLNDAKGRGDLGAFQMLEGDFKTKQRVTIGLYGIGLATVVTGLVLRQMGVGDAEVVVAPTNGGGVVSLEWQR